MTSHTLNTTKPIMFTSPLLKSEGTKQEKEAAKLKHKVKELQEFKKEKHLEEKELKAKEKKIEQKLKNIGELEAKLKLAKIEVPKNIANKVDEIENEKDELEVGISPGVPVSNIFEVLSDEKPNQLEDDENLTLVNYDVPNSSLDPPCTLDTISNLNTSNNSRDTTTSKNLNIFTDEDHLSPTEEIELMNRIEIFCEGRYHDIEVPGYCWGIEEKIVLSAKQSAGG